MQRALAMMLVSVLDLSPRNQDAWEQSPARWNIQISGALQGVGFRAFVRDLATRLNLHGFVASGPCEVAIEVEGARSSLGDFLEELWLAPTSAHIDRVSCHAGPIRGGAGFQIVG